MNVRLVTIVVLSSAGKVLLASGLPKAAEKLTLLVINGLIF